MALAEELIAGGLGYTRARLGELEAAALADVASFVAAALGDAAVLADAGRVNRIEGFLTSARDELALFATALAAASFVDAATHLGDALAAIDRAAAEVGRRSLAELLREHAGWATAVPKGLAQQLGLPARVPSPQELRLDGRTLVFEISAAGKSLAPAPFTLGFRDAKLSARLQLDATAPRFAVSLALDGIEAGVGGGEISSLIGGASGSVTADVVFGFDPANGLTLSGGGGKRVVLPARPAAGTILDLREIALELPEGTPDAIDIASTIATDIGGIVKATVDGAGVRIAFDAGALRDGDNPLSVSPRGPTGIGLSLDAGIVRGGGFLGKRSGGYGGALQLRLGPVEVKAVGLLTLEPSFALVVVMSVEFLPPIDLSFGFTLNAVGGIVGIEHRMDTDALRDRFASGALDHILFPPDPVAAAPAILDTLEAVFPHDEGSIVIGPMVELGWGRPVSFLSAQLGVILSLPDPKIVIIGRVRIALPAPQAPIIDLRATVFGEITPDHLLIRVSLIGSRMGGYTLSGDIGMLLRWAGSSDFAISAGGFHPRFDAPRELAGMQRLRMDMSPPAVLTMRADSYFALTPNSVQLGSRIEMGADLVVASISGHLEFDALVIFSPHFLFMIDLGIGLTVRVMGVTLCGVSIQLHLEGPGPWRAEGHAEVEILWTTIGVDVGPFEWGDADNPPPADADPRKLVFDALNRNPGSWQAIVPPYADRVVRLLPATPSETEVTVHPMGMFEVRQHAIPLETVIVRVGPNPVPQGRRRVHLGKPTVNRDEAGALSEVKDLFSAGNFLDLTDDEKLSRPAFEQMPAGARIRPPGEEAPYDASRHAELRYETYVCDDVTMIGKSSRARTTDQMFKGPNALALASGAAGASELRATSRYATAPDPIVLADPGEVRIVSKQTLGSVARGDVLTYTHAAEVELGAGLQLARLGVA